MSLDAAFLRAIEAAAPTRLHEPLSRHTTIGIGGPADAYVMPETTPQMVEVLRLCAEASVPVFVLGSGSNIVIGDHGIRGVVLDNRAQQLTDLGPMPSASVHGEPVQSHDAKNDPPSSPSPRKERGPGSEVAPAPQGVEDPESMSQDTAAPESMPQPSGRGIADAAPLPLPSDHNTETDTRTRFKADSGCSFAAVARQLAFAGYAGLEWACGIPGTIGGAVVYNAGAYGGCLADVLLRAGLWDAEHGEHVLEAADLGLVYRGSAFTRGLMRGRAVLWAEFALWPGEPEALRARVADYDSRRLKAQPRGRNAGSFFKNPPGHPAWKLLDDAGMRGYGVGGAQFSDKHCNFLINTGGATAADVAALKREAQTRVRERFGVDLENEVTLVGEGFGDA
ncbi:MAG TPA: UDP-N-acetylmuramate dehydrogenase [Dehalococcoidia bacterium]|nr:UDP-N-acetylmuramate dehydrogenase [Dehalococcoidia bacterium]